MLALIRPDSWNLPLFLHVLGASVLTGAVAATLIAASRSQASLLLRRVAFRTLLLLVVPAWVLMRFAGQWIDSKEDIQGDPTWLGIGYIVGDAGLILVILTTITAWVAARRPEKRWPPQAVTVLAGIYLAALLVAMFAMSGKPGR
jgi:hypothetical protein